MRAVEALTKEKGVIRPMGSEDLPVEFRAVIQAIDHLMMPEENTYGLAMAFIRMRYPGLFAVQVEDVHQATGFLLLNQWGQHYEC